MQTDKVHPPLRHFLLFKLSLAIFALSGCAATGSLDLPDMDSWESRKTILAKTDEWEFTGRIGVSAGEEGFNGKLFWRQDGVVFRARISGPLGMGTVFINGNRGELTVTDSDGVVTELNDAEAELRQMYGWTIPVTSFRFWALGVPDPGQPSSTEFDDEGYLSRLEQSGWIVEISGYREGGGQQMPRTLTVTNPETRVRMVIDRWLFFGR